MHGLLDDCVPYEGGGALARPPIEDDIASWRDHDDCEETGTDATEDGVRRRAWTCADGASVELITLDDHGHAWSGAPADTLSPPCGGERTDPISTTAEAWRFFQAHP